MENIVCPYCKESILAEAYFCPNCGKKIKDKPLSTTFLKQTVVYLVSVFLPPFGLPWAFRYLKQGDTKSKTIGFVVIGLTTVSLILTIWFTVGFINNINQEITKQLNGSINLQ